MSPLDVAVAVDTVVTAVVAVTSHPLMVVQTSEVMLCTVELPVVPEKKDVDNVTVSVHWATAELAVHVGEAELVLLVKIESVFHSRVCVKQQYTLLISTRMKD